MQWGCNSYIVVIPGGCDFTANWRESRCGNFTEGTDGLTVRLRHSKTDQEGAGRTNGIPYGSNQIGRAHV